MNALEVLNQTRDAMTARRVYGEPYQQDGVTVIPAANVWGGGGGGGDTEGNGGGGFGMVARPATAVPLGVDRKSTRLNSSHRCISYAVFCLKKKRNKQLNNVSER